MKVLFCSILVVSVAYGVAQNPSSCEEQCANNTLNHWTNQILDGVRSLLHPSQPDGLNFASNLIADLCREQINYRECMEKTCSSSASAALSTNSTLTTICSINTQALFEANLTACASALQREVKQQCGTVLLKLFITLSQFSNSIASDELQRSAVCSQLAAASACTSSTVMSECYQEISRGIEQALNVKLDQVNTPDFERLSPGCQEALRVFGEIQSFNASIYAPIPTASMEATTAATVILGPSNQMPPEVENCVSACFNQTINVILTDMSSTIENQTKINAGSEKAAADSVDQMCSMQQAFADCIAAECPDGVNVAQQYAPIRTNQALILLCVDRKDEFTDIMIPCAINSSADISRQCNVALTNWSMLMQDIFEDSGASMEPIEDLCVSTAKSAMCIMPITRERCSEQAQQLTAEFLAQALMPLSSGPQAEKIANTAPECSKAINEALVMLNIQTTVPPFVEKKTTVEAIPGEGVRRRPTDESAPPESSAISVMPLATVLLVVMCAVMML